MKDCNTPANRSKYICNTTGIPACNNGIPIKLGVKLANAPYNKFIIIIPPTIFPNKRKPKDIGVASSPIIFNGNSKANGSAKPLI